MKIRLIVLIYAAISTLFTYINSKQIDKDQTYPGVMLRPIIVIITSWLWPLTWWITLLVWFALKTKHKYNKIYILSGITIALADIIGLCYIFIKILKF